MRYIRTKNPGERHLISNEVEAAAGKIRASLPTGFSFSIDLVATIESQTRVSALKATISRLEAELEAARKTDIDNLKFKLAAEKRRNEALVKEIEALKGRRAA